MQTGSLAKDLTVLLARQVAEQQLVLPLLPSIAAEVLGLAQLEATDAARLSQVMHRDPTLASSVLRVANSAAFAGQVPCASLQQAVSRLGLQRVTEIAVAIAVRGAVFANKRHGEQFAQLWRHSVVTAFFAKEIARARRRNVETAFLCGLLHDIGQAVLLTTAERLLPESQVLSEDLTEGLLAQHASAGGLLVRHWQLPASIVESIEHHHSFDEARQFQDLAMTVCLADLLAHQAAEQGAPWSVCSAPIRKHPVLLGLSLYPDQLDALMAKAPQALAAAEGLQ